ncbi:hypothetical protein FN846DRAFT_903403 [Sphaerosporella brunnea]|uniref:Uncharacterized protein n=1 Tax=Sphaerosporella brunnea TaxID=1250544 RepID=A0A5J5F7F5_9PEZI|nr:hypothetical protein FN846DRAFT_903403 [Sphaerosporella brunnea]
MPPRPRKDPPAPRQLKQRAAPRHVHKAAAAAVPTLDNPPHELIVEMGKSLTASSDIYHLMQTCRTVRAIFDNQLYSTAVRCRQRLKLVVTHNVDAVRRLLATGALAPDLEFYRGIDGGLVECTQMLHVAIERRDEQMVRLLVEAGCSLFCVAISPAAAEQTALGRLLKEHGVKVSPTGAPNGLSWMMDPFPAGRPVITVLRFLCVQGPPAVSPMHVHINDPRVEYPTLVRWELPSSG